MRNSIHFVRAIFVSASLLVAPALKAEERCCKTIRTDFGEISVASRDVSLATEFGNHVSRMAKEVLRLTGVRFTIVDANHSKYKWADTTPDGLAVYPWKFVHGTNYVGLQPPNSILPHEMGHDLLNRHVIPSTRTGQYGTDAPDWIDESVAVAFELPEERAQRRCEASSLLRSGRLIPLSRFLAMTHPDLASIRNADARARDFTYDSTMAADTPAFYAMSMAFPEYLSEKTKSTSVLADVIDAFRKGVPPGQWILSKLAGPDRSQDIQKVEQDFVAWLGSSRDYECKR